LPGACTLAQAGITVFPLKLCAGRGNDPTRESAGFVFEADYK